MIRSWYRSRLFWLGLPGLVFLLWLWWDSMSYSTTVSLSWEGRSGGVFAPTTEGLSVAHACGSVHLWENEYPFLPLPMRFGLGYGMSRVSMDDFMKDPFEAVAVEWSPALSDWFPRPLMLPVDDDPFSSEGPRVAIWFLIILYSASWVGACFAWQRWKRRRLRDREGRAVD